MQFSFAIISSALLFLATQASGAAVDTSAIVDRAAETATDPFVDYACNCPNNCSHKAGSSCAYYDGPSDTSGKVYGTCASRGGSLSCIGN
ncbi:hypothetical protein ONZ43_g3728 [Nemania bipapillata]|uniref:Uncharacterized protein n=1 Tax=Nemania bipapillata TaxID=110536 RepID=A0ACC2IW52_9PEZI|nr:hypothetical protein ONZ43_g3728 [Nemania bipapillata]